jgi:hypothetical protein
MIKIENQDTFAQVIADALKSVASNTAEGSTEQRRYVNAIAKAAARIEQRGCFMDHDESRLLIWSESNEIYEIAADGRCECLAEQHHAFCWHRAAKRLIERYNEAMCSTEHISEDFEPATCATEVLR